MSSTEYEILKNRIDKLEAILIDILNKQNSIPPRPCDVSIPNDGKREQLLTWG